MCRKYAASTGVWKQENEKEEPTFENLRIKGNQRFLMKDVFRLCKASGSGRRQLQEKIFEDCYLSDSVWFSAKQAYLAYVSRNT